MLFTLKELALINSTIRPIFKPNAMLLVFIPLAYVLGSVSVRISTLAICFIIQPFSFVDIAICVVQFAMSVSFSGFPLPLIAGAIGPVLLAIAVSQPSQPFTLIHSPGVQCNRPSYLSFAQLVV